MYGTIVRYRPRPGREQAIEEYERRWLHLHAPEAEGFLGEYRLTPRSDAGELFALVLFDSEANYRKNAVDPEQDRWYRELRDLLVADPEWHDGEIVELTGDVVPV